MQLQHRLRGQKQIRLGCLTLGRGRAESFLAETTHYLIHTVLAGRVCSHVGGFVLACYKGAEAQTDLFKYHFSKFGAHFFGTYTIL